MASKSKKPEKSKILGGAPTKYKPEFCEMLIAHMSKGMSYNSFPAGLNVHLDTLYEWEKVHPLFSEAKRIGFAKNLEFWEQAGVQGLWEQTKYDEKGKPISKRTLNSTVWIFNMKNRHKWKDKQDDEVSKTTIVVNSMKDALKETMQDKTTEELVEIVKGASKE